MRNVSANRRKLLLYAVVLFFPVAFFLVLESGLRYFDYGDNLDLFVPAPAGFADKNFLMTNPEIARRYFSSQSYRPRPPDEYFLQEKPKNGYRIFVLGESTTAGWPYPNNVMFSRMLNQRLAEAFPERDIEVVNTALAAVNSFTLNDFMDEILAQRPDAILLYAGHNEFYGALGAGSTESLGRVRWVVKAYLALLRFKTMQLLRDVVNNSSGWIAGLVSDKSPQDPYPTLMGRMIGEASIPYGSATYQVAKRHFQENLREIFGKAQQAGVPVLASELVSNVRDHRPFAAVHEGDQLSADVIFEWAKLLDKEQMHGMARTAYYWAKDMDGLRFRASEEFNDVIHQVAAEFKVPVVPMKSYFEAVSPQGIIGANLMLEHLHPNSDGYLLMSEAFFQGMRQHQFISATWDANKIRPLAFYAQYWGITELDRALGAFRVMQLMDHWPFQPPSSPTRIFADYQPQTKAEELAYRVAKEELDFFQAHVELAAYYFQQGQNERAFGEYQALINAVPYDANVYLGAASVLLQQRQYEQALPLLYGSLTLKDSSTANKWIGQIHLYNNRPQEALKFLEKAFALEPKDPQLLYNLAGAYGLTGQKDNGRRLFAHLEKLAPDFPRLDQLKQLLNQP